MRILILGAGGHAQVVADILLRMREKNCQVDPIGYLDDNPKFEAQFSLGLPVLGRISDLATITHDAIVVAIGNNRTRQHLFENLQSEGERFVPACHPGAIIAPDVVLGPGCVVCAGVVVNPGCQIGANVILNTGCIVDHHSILGNHVHVAPGVRTGGEVVIGEGALVGIGATIMPHRRIGAWSVVGAGALVYHDVPNRATVVGVPARVILQAEEES